MILNRGNLPAIGCFGEGTKENARHEAMRVSSLTNLPNKGRDESPTLTQVVTTTTTLPLAIILLVLSSWTSFLVEADGAARGGLIES